MRLEIQYLDPEALNFNHWNPNSLSPEHEEKLKQSIKRFGTFKPILVRETDTGLEVLGGEHRCKIAREMGIKEVPVINLGKIDDNKAKEISLVDNERYGSDDHLALTELMHSLDTAVELPDFLPITEDELFTLQSEIELNLDDLDIDEELDDKEEVETPPPPKTHQIMRFKIPIENVDIVKDAIQSVIDGQGYSDSDGLINAGDALVDIINGVKEDGS